MLLALIQLSPHCCNGMRLWLLPAEVVWSLLTMLVLQDNPNLNIPVKPDILKQMHAQYDRSKGIMQIYKIAVDFFFIKSCGFFSIYYSFIAYSPCLPCHKIQIMLPLYLAQYAAHKQCSSCQMLLPGKQNRGGSLWY